MYSFLRYKTNCRWLCVGNSFRKLYRVHCSVVVSLPNLFYLFSFFFKIDKMNRFVANVQTRVRYLSLFTTLQWLVEPCDNEEYLKTKETIHCQLTYFHNCTLLGWLFMSLHETNLLTFLQLVNVTLALCCEKYIILNVNNCVSLVLARVRFKISRVFNMKKFYIIKLNNEHNYTRKQWIIYAWRVVYVGCMN